jgi:F-type H+-transporting ATPase subunit delta
MAKEDLAQTYAQAIFGQAVEGWHAALKLVSTSLEKSGLTEKLDNSSTSFSKKEELLRDVVPAKAAPEVNNLVKLLASKNHVHLLPQIIDEFERRSTHGLHARIARVTSAVQLNDAEKRKLESKLSAKFGSDAEFEYVVNPEVLGGVVVRVGDKVLDGSVAGKLAALKEQLKA